MTLDGKMVLITGAAKRIGRSLALMSAHHGADIIIHYNTSQKEAERTQVEVERLGRKAFILQADLSDGNQAVRLMEKAQELGPVFGLVNNAAVFKALTWENSSPADWNNHLQINLTSPFLLSQAFFRSLGSNGVGRIVNLLDWRALRPGPDHLPYTISKSALAALTRSLAAAFAPRVTVNGLALGAILPPYEEPAATNILDQIPAQRWADPNEVGEALDFLLDGPGYVTGEILHVDGGRHLV